MKNSFFVTLSLLAAMLFSGCGEDTSVAGENNAKAALGKALFTSKAFSRNRTMACATCHDLEHAMADPRPVSAVGASLGDDGSSRGDRNAPTAAYAAFSPEFRFDTEAQLYIGGQFLDGRAADLKAQAKGPFVNPVEMNMSSPSAVVARAKDDPLLSSQLKAVYGDEIFQDDTQAYDAIADAIAAFEQTETFAPFDSKFDRVYEGTYTYTPLEKEGKVLFEGKAGCIACHPTEGRHALLTDFSYDNLGVPVNTALRSLNGVTEPDKGLGGRNDIADAARYGKFKVSTLRNVAVTPPYMHNGVFKTLKSVVHFYNTRDVPGAINPETNMPWNAAEMPLTVNHDELGDLGLSEHEEDAIVAFLKTLTDRKFEHLVR